MIIFNWMTMPHRHVFVDSCSFTFWRATATLSWWSRWQPDIQPSIDNLELMSRLESQYLKSLDLVQKEVCVQAKDMLLVRDVPHHEVWRRDYFPSYKANRDTETPSKYGPFIKHLNSTMSSRYRNSIRVKRAEADDIIAILTRYLKFNDPDCEIVIVANDSDYNQLMRYSNVTIYNPKSKSWITCDNPISALDSKIKSGDSSDSVPAGTYHHLKRLLIDLSCIPRSIQDQVIHSYMELDNLAPQCTQYHPMPIQLGLCCMNTKLQSRKIICSRTLRLTTLETKGLEELKKRARLNCTDLMTHLRWNAANGIRVFRMSSDLFPHKSNPKAPNYTFDFALDLLHEAGRYARDTGQRLTFHPGQYNVVGTPKEDMFKKTVADLDWHAEVLDLMGCGPDSVIVVHAGGIYGDKEATKKRWITNFSRLPERVRRRLVLENCEKGFSVVDCIDVSRGCGVPVVLDTHHFACYIQMHPKETFESLSYYIPDILATWSRRHIKPKMHVSEQNPTKQIGAHSDLISRIPDELLEIPKRYGVSIDIMIEAKLKEQAIEKLYEVHPELDPHYVTGFKVKVKVPVRKIHAKIRPKPIDAPKQVLTRVKIKARLRPKVENEFVTQSKDEP